MDDRLIYEVLEVVGEIPSGKESLMQVEDWYQDGLNKKNY